ncbi:C4-dicarboxylate TRAP transporter substrate-binding protein [Amorphus orientalis]|uniref:TRAP-type C4-dicarboxylate transport system substrate-binding protein n=1 Tax=Amorphus orientalis TaxID=649198 RepID=A0AAE3VM10_9HYPH|nr:C4-dicarboxylate TRAP transporter substrate-binding protein [Amorphus orientalis]MDQ0314422.1 TRAP-type C4-dicarboxylate transport system substrate-binding protein [Amorphus orientalis]
MSLRSLLGGAAVSAMLATAAAGPAHAETIDATVVNGHPPVFLWVKTLSEAFIPAVDQALEGTDYDIDWMEAYGGTLANVGGELEALEDGLAQIGIVPSLFEPSLLSLQNVSYVTPFGSPDVDLVLTSVDDMHDEIPDMRKLWEEHDLVYLGGGFGLEDYLLMTQFPVDSIADLEGRKINAPGPAVNWLKGTGAVGVSGNLTTYYNDLQTGVTEGVIVFPTAAAAAKLQEVAKYVTRTHFGAQYAGGIVANKDWYDGLPDEVKAAIDTGVEAFAKAYRAGLEQRVQAAFTSMEENGAEISELSPEAQAEWANALPNIPMEWAKEQEDKGLAGTVVVETYLDKLRAGGAELPRDWTQN